MTQKEINEIYKLQRKRFSDKKRYYKKKYGLELKTPKLVKHPTEKTLERFASNVYLQTEKAKKQAKKQAKKKRAQKKIPTRGEILLERLREIIKEGLQSENKFENYKADRVDDLINENLPAGKEARIKKLQEWEKAIPALDDAIQQFIFDSKQTDTETKNHSTYLWNTISSLILGRKAIFEEVYEDE